MTEYIDTHVFTYIYTGAVTIARGAIETGATEIGTAWSVCAPSGGVEL
jgi:hypothetical protein